jgi:sugar lactone lactonase YvrE
LTFALPQAGIDAVTWSIPQPPANTPGLATAQPVVLTGSTTLTGTVAMTGITSGAYRLVLTFYRGGTDGTVAGVDSEAVNVWDNLVSDRWLDSTGTLQTGRAFAATDFNSATSSLANLTASAGTWGATPFSSSTGAYTVTTNTAVSLTPTQSVAGQEIRYQAAGVTTLGWTSLASGSPSAPVAPGTTVTFSVTANDGTTSSTYTVNVGSQATLSWTTTSPNAVLVEGPATLTYGMPAVFRSLYTGTTPNPTGYAWYLDGVTVPGASNPWYCFIPTASLSWGAHRLMVVVSDSSGVFYSGERTLTCSNAPGAPLALNGTVTTVATLAFNAGDIATDGANLYVADVTGNEIWKVVIASGAATVLATGLHPDAITTDGANLYVADNASSKIWKVAIATQAVTTLTSGLTTAPVLPYRMTTDGTNLYVVDNDNGTVLKVVAATGVVTTLVPATSWNYFGITTDGTNLYVSDTDSSRMLKIAGSGAVTALTTGYLPSAGLTTDGTSLYAADTARPYQRISLATGAVSTLVTGAPATAITTDGTSLYLTDGGLTIRRIQ